MNLELGTDLAGVVADHVRRYVADLLAGRRHPTELPFNGPDAVAPSRGEGRDAGRDTEPVPYNISYSRTGMCYGFRMSCHVCLPSSLRRYPYLLPE